MLANVHVLLVDDDADTIDMYVFGLSQLGARVTTAATASEAFDLFRREPPDVVVSDIVLEDTEGGYDLVRAIRALDAEAGGDVPAVALAGWTRSTDEDRALAEGFTAYCRKPCTPDDIASVVAAQVAIARQVRHEAACRRVAQRRLRSELQQRQQELRGQRDRLDAQWWKLHEGQ